MESNIQAAVVRVDMFIVKAIETLPLIIGGLTAGFLIALLTYCILKRGVKNG